MDTPEADAEISEAKEFEVKSGSETLIDNQDINENEVSNDNQLDIEVNEEQIIPETNKDTFENQPAESEEAIDKRGEESIDERREESIDKRREESIDKRREESIDKRREESIDKKREESIDKTEFDDIAEEEKVVEDFEDSSAVSLEELSEDLSIQEEIGETDDSLKTLSEHAELGIKDIVEQPDDNILDVSVTDRSSVSRKGQEVQSESAEPEGIPDYNLRENLYEKDSMVNALFNGSHAPFFKCDSEIQVTVFLPNSHSFSKLYPSNINILELKKSVAEMVDLEPGKLLFSLMGNSTGEYISDWTPLYGIPPNTVGGLVLNLSYKFEVEIKRIVEYPCNEKYAPIITVRQVKVINSLGKHSMITVVTKDISYVKEWLGGFRNTKTGQMYHNASTETSFWDRKRKTNFPVEINYSRDAQTHLPYLTKFTQVDANKGTQMWRPDHYIQSVGDKVLTAKPYTEYELRPEHQIILESVIKIQRWYRCLASKRIQREAFSNLIALIKKQREKKSAAEAALTNEKVQYLLGVCFPTTRNDFFNLYSIIGMWWKKEFSDISKIKCISERRAAHYDLLQNEVDLLSALDKQRIKSKAEALQRRELKLLEATTRPIIRHQRKRNMTIVETLEVQRARELKEVYMAYSRNDLNKKERLQVILSLINIVETFDELDITKDLINLMRREIDLMSMGIEFEYLKGLKKRIEEGLLHFVRDKDFNPQVKNHRPIHFPRVNQRSYRCTGCRKLKNPADSNIHVRLKCYRSCKSCDWMHTTAHNALNISPYALILNLLRAREITKCPRCTYCFALQPFGAHFIINTIWNGKSALSETMDLPKLRLCRWDNKLEWSPWNTILLTVEEAEIHERIYDNSEVYEYDFIQSVKIRHITTRFHFKVMDETEIYCRETGLWDSAHDENIYQHIYHRREALQPIDPLFKPPHPKAFVRPQHVKQLPRCSASNNYKL